MTDDGQKDGKKNKKGDYKVGYCVPPASGKFQLGKSGNPSGKKKGKSRAQYIAEAGEVDKTFSLGGQPVTLPANKALAQKLFTEALKGNHQAAKLILDAQKSVLGDKPFGDGPLGGPEELEVARTHADWLNLIEHAAGGHADDDASE